MSHHPPPQELDPPIRSTISRISSTSWLIGGTHICCLFDPDSADPSLVQWTDDTGQQYCLQHLRAAVPETTPLEPFYWGSTASGVWAFAGLVWKVRTWMPGTSNEASTIAFVKQRLPAIPVPEVVWDGVDERNSRSFLLMRKARGEMLDAMWAGLTEEQRSNVAESIAEYMAQLSRQKRAALGTVNGCGVPDGWIQPSAPCPGRQKPDWQFSLLRLVPVEQVRVPLALGYRA